MARKAIWIVLAASLAAASGAAAAGRPSADAIAGKRLAREYCGGCHAVGPGRSPLRDAPPFRDLHKRYREGGLSELLREGMLRPASPPEEGAPRRHPRMPMRRLDDDQVAELTAYLQSLEPHSRPHRRSHR